MDACDIETIVAKCLDGDRRAQQELFGLYRAPIARFVCRTLGPATKLEVEDTIQQAYIELFRSLGLFQGLSSFETWVYRICSRVCMMQLRKKYRKRQIDVIDGDADMVDFVADEKLRPDLLLHRRELLGAFYEALDRVKPDRRLAFILYEIEGRSIDEVAAIMDKPEGTIKSALFRARADLGRILRRFREEPARVTESCTAVA